MADALATAHGAGIVHGGLTASTLLLTADDTVKVSDFGVALLGGEPADPADDVRALGEILAERVELPRMTEVLARMRADDPADRPTAQECAVALEGAATADLGPDWLWRANVPLETRPAPVPLPVATPRPTKGRRGIVAAVVVAVCVLALLAGGTARS